MVKRIRKRVEKPQSEDTELENDAPPEDQPSDFAQQLDALAEDRLTTALAGWFKFVVQNKGIIIVATLAIVAGWGILAYLDHSAEEKRALAADEVQSAFETAKKAAAAADDFAALQKQYLDNKDKEPAPNEPAPEAPNPEKHTAALKQALQEFQTARENNADNPIQTLALLGEASIQYELGDFKASAEAFSQAAAADPATTLVKMVSLQGQAAASEDSGDRETAAKLWKDIEALDSEAFGLTARLQQGRLLEAQGAFADAQSLYASTRADYAAALEAPANKPFDIELEAREKRLKLRN